VLAAGHFIPHQEHFVFLHQISVVGLVKHCHHTLDASQIKWMPVAKESGVNTHLFRTPISVVNQALSLYLFYKPS